MDTNTDGLENTISKTDECFKKPILVGKIGRLPKKIIQTTPSEKLTSLKIKENDSSSSRETIEKFKSPLNSPLDGSEGGTEKSTKSDEQSSENTLQLPYKEPSWSGLPHTNGKKYEFEVLKNGTIIERFSLMDKSFFVFGRLPNCNISMQHPTISRYHAILQYRQESNETESSGFYIYDLGSTHGTYLNKNRLKPKVYVRIQVGHMLKLGCSTRSYILTGPEDDAEDESEFTVTELKQKREEQVKEAERRREEMRKKEEEKGIDWGLGEDADEETDLSENPFAQTTNEELYLDDPKKALRGFFEREGLELEYDCNEQGLGQFVCKVELPLDDELGRPIVAEVLHKGKKKEAVVQCALEACRILDRHGVLRQAVHESRKRKAKNWEENDFYDSDDDTFLDRTGTIEKKREKRMKAKIPEKAETYEGLLEKQKSILDEIANLENQISQAQQKNQDNSSNTEEDSLDSFMKGLKDTKPDKQTLSKLKLDLTKMRDEHAKIVRLINIAKPTNLPELVFENPVPSTSSDNGKDTKNKMFPIIGKRKKIKIQVPSKPVSDNLAVNMDVDEVEEEKEEEQAEPEGEEYKPVGVSTETVTSEEQNPENTIPEPEEGNSRSSSNSSDEDLNTEPTDFSSIKSLHNNMSFKKFEKILKKGLPPLADKHQEKLEKILNNLKKLAANEDRMHVDWKMLAAKKRKVMKLISDLRHCEPNEKLEHKVSSELNRLLMELNVMTEQKYRVIDEVKKMGNEIKNISEAIDKDFKAYKKGMSKDADAKSEAGSSTSSVIEKAGTSNSSRSLSSEEDAGNGDNTETEEKKKKKNQRRIQQRQERTEIERQRGYEEDATREDYNMWVPPTDQTGDGRTSLNDKLGY